MKTPFLAEKKIAIVYDWIDKWGGVERVLLTLQEMFPRADFFTSYYDPGSASWANKLNIKTSFIQRLPDFIKKNRLFSLFLYPYAFESFDFSAYDLVISVTSSFAKAVITKPNTVHICYLLTPTRFLWLYPEIYTDNWFKRLLFMPFMTRLKMWDFIAGQRPDYYLSISKTVQQRLRKYYRQDSEVIYPAFDTDYWKKMQNEKIKQLVEKKFFLVVSRLESYKKLYLVIETFNELPERLVVVGKGTQFDKLKRLAKQRIIFLQNLKDEELGWLYQNTEALIMPQEEDFGYVALEAQFFGCPVIAFRKGGATETVLENKTGLFFEKQTVDDLQKALAKFHTMSYTLKKTTQKLGVENIEKFSRDRFIKKFYECMHSLF